MGDIIEDRVYAAAATTEVVVAAGIGVVSVSVSGDQVGRFGVARRCAPRDVAAGDGRLAVATDSDVLVRSAEEFVQTGFGPAVAVGVHERAVLAADAEGRVARFGDDGGGWTDIGTVDASVRAIDGALLATDGGVYRIRGSGADATIRAAGLESANDVAATGPFAATDEGLFALGDDWMRSIGGCFTAVTAAARDHAYAVSNEYGASRKGVSASRERDHDASREPGVAPGGTLYERSEDGWRAIDLQAEDPAADVAIGERAYVITESGTLFVAPEWHSRSLGLADVVGIAVA